MGWERIAFVSQKGTSLADEWESTKVFDRDVSFFRIGLDPSQQELLNIVLSILQKEIRVIFLNVGIGEAATITLTLQSLGVLNSIQIVADPNLATLGVVQAFADYGLSRELFSGAIGLRYFEDFTEPAMQSWAAQYVGYYLTNPGNVPFVPPLVGNISDFANNPPRRYEALHYDSVYLIARAMQSAYDSGIDGNDINATSLLPFIHNGNFSGAVFQDVR